MFILYGFVVYMLVMKLKLLRKINKIEIVLWVIYFEIISNDIKIIRVIDNIIKMDDFDSNEWDYINIDVKKGKICFGKYYLMMFMLILLVSIFCFLLFWVFVLLEIKNKVFWNNLMY